MEKRDLYDENKIKTGETIFKDEPIPLGKYILVVLVFIQNSNGKFLIQKRSTQKDGMYGSTGGHPKSGETDLDGMITEIKEELGILVSEKDLNFVTSDKDDHVIFSLYYMKSDLDINSLTLQKEEVDFVKWMSASEIEELTKLKKFLPSHAESFERIKEYLKN